MIQVTKPYLPNINKYKKYIDRIYESCQLTNNGPLVQELENRLAEYLEVKNVILVANGTLALNIAYRALSLKGEVITTPFSFVATTNSLISEGLIPIFSDIDSNTFNINPEEIRRRITSKTSAIVPVHVFGNPCEVENIQAISKENNLKVIYDAAHAFDIQYKDRSILSYGNISTLSFHSTKLFHTIEGGALIVNDDDDVVKKVRQLINFGYDGKSNLIVNAGINAKMNEFEAAMGLCILDDISKIKSKRKDIYNIYLQGLGKYFSFQNWNENGTRNYGYFPILLKSNEQLLLVQKKLNVNNIFPRRYFEMSLDLLSYINNTHNCSNSQDISKRILCLPLYNDLSIGDAKIIVSIIEECNL